MNWIIEHITDLINIATTIIAASSAIAALTPSQVDDPVVAYIRRFIDILALNIGQASNKSTDETLVEKKD